MANIKQTILVREDLKLPMGLMAAQCAHIHMEKFRKIMLQSDNNMDSVSGQSKIVNLKMEDYEWLKEPYVYIHGVPNLEVLQMYIDIAEVKCIPVSIWKDTIFISLFEGNQSVLSDIIVGASFGPADSDKIKAIIGALPLLK